MILFERKRQLLDAGSLRLISNPHHTKREKNEKKNEANNT